MDVAWLPLEIWETLREISGVLAGAAGDLENQAAVGQPIAQHPGDRLPVAECCRSGAARFPRGCFVKALARHQARPRTSSSKRRARRNISSLWSVNMPSAKASRGSV